MIQTPRPVQKLRGEYKLREQLDLTLASELVPVVLVDDLSGPSVADPGYPRDAMGIISVPGGGAGTNVQCVCVGTGNRGKIYRINRAIVQKPTAGRAQIQLGLGATITGLTNIVTKGYLDGRVGTEVPDLSIQESTPLTAAIDGTQVGIISFDVADQQLDIDLGWILPGGEFASIVNQTADEQLRVTYFWTEYLLEDR